MARPRMKEVDKRKKVTLTISPEVYQKMESLKMGGINISEICQKAIDREYKKALKNGKIGEADMVGQLSIQDLEK